MFVCDYCENNITPNVKIFRGFDCTFCSDYCRQKITVLNIDNNNRISDYNLWYKAKPNKIVIESTLKRTESIINLQNKNFSTNTKPQFNYNKFNNIYKFINITISTMSIMSLYISSSIYKYIY